MPSSEIDLVISVDEAGSDAEQLDTLTTYLQRDLRELGVDSIERSTAGAAPEGAKGDPFTLGALALVVAPVLLPQLLEFLQAFSLRGEQRVVKIKTPDGLEVEFTPEKRLSEAEVLALAKKLTQIDS
jgi:hypothetical protein